MGNRCDDEAALPVPLARQLTSQAPQDAVGIHLVLPPVRLGDGPRYGPQPTAPGTVSFWTLQPPRLPHDDRLRDGEIYGSSGSTRKGGASHSTPSKASRACAMRCR